MSQDLLYNASPVKGQPEDSKEASTPAKATAPADSDVSTPVKSPDAGSPALKSSGKHRRNLTLDRNQKKAGNVAVLCREAAKWLNEVLELEEGKDVAASSKDVDSFFSSIEDGVILSRVINRIDPDNPIKFRADAKPGTFMARDNIAVWLDKARALGVPDATMFEVTDLVSKKEQLIPQWHIVITILEIARAAGRFGYALPAIISLMYDEQIDVEKLAQLEEQRMALLEGDKKKKEAELEAKKDVERAERERILTSAAIERADRERSLVEAAEAKMKADAEAARLKAEAEERAARLKAEAEERARLKAEADDCERLRLQRASEEAAEKAAWEQKYAQERVKHPCFQLVTTADLRSKTHKGRALGHTIMELHNRSFPPDPSDTKGESKRLSDDDKLEAFISKAIGFHEEDNCNWLLLWSDQDHASAELLGYTTLFTYHDSMYLANLCVEPESRNRGLGTALLHEAQDEAWRIGKLTAVSGTVDANDSSLQRFYRNLGATVDVSQSVISGNAAAPPSGRLKKIFALGEDGIVRDSDRAPKFVRATDIRLSTHIEPGPRKTKLLRDDDDGTGPLRVQRIDFPVKKPFRKSWLTLGILGAGSVSAYYYLVLKRAV